MKLKNYRIDGLYLKVYFKVFGLKDYNGEKLRLISENHVQGYLESNSNFSTQ